MARDGGRCVADGVQFGSWQAYSAHHRILGDRADNRPSNMIMLCGTGATGCHGLRVHGHAHRDDEARGRRWAERLGYRVSRHADRETTLTIPVWYDQPGLRVGWYYLDDDGGLSGPLDLPRPVEADLARRAP